MITYMDQGMILFLNSLKPSVGKELMNDISSNVNSNIISIPDETKVFCAINDPNDCDVLQSDF